MDEEEKLPTEVIIQMWEDLIYVEALTIIHGDQNYAIERVREMRGYGG